MRSWSQRLALSRNKVAVSEGAAGSPPFYGMTVSYCFIKANMDDFEVELSSFS